MKRGPISYGDPIEVVVHSTCGVQWEDPIEAALNGISRVSLGVMICVCADGFFCFLVIFLCGFWYLLGLKSTTWMSRWKLGSMVRISGI